MSKIKKIKKRDGSIQKFDPQKITKAIWSAAQAVGGTNRDLSKDLTKEIVQILEDKTDKGEIPTVETVQDIVEKQLVEHGHYKTAKAYILYRFQHTQLREFDETLSDTSLIDNYIREKDWRVKENSNMSYSLQGLNVHIADKVVKKYWLEKIYPPEIRKEHNNSFLHIHDLGTLGTYSFFGKETIVAKVNKTIKLLSFEQLYKELSCKEKVLNKKDKAYAKYPENLKVLDKNGWTNVSRLVRKKKEKDVNFIKSEQGRSVIVTNNHPFIVKDKKDGKEKEIKAGSVNEKDHFISSHNIPSLLEKEKLFNKKSIYIAEELFNNDYKDFFLGNFKVENFINEQGGSLRSKDSISTSNNANSLDNKLELSQDLGYLIGIFIAEGNYDSHRLTITNNNKKIIKKIVNVCSGLGVRSYVREKKSKGKAVTINSSTLKLVFEKIFKIKPLSRNKNIPFKILEYNKDFLKGIIAGVIDGDGSVKTSKTQISIRLSSRILLEQIATLLQFFNIIVRDRSDVGEIGKIHKFKDREIVQNYPIYGIAFSKRKHLKIPSFKYKKAKNAKSSWRANKYGWNKVLNNKKTAIPETEVYDITTESKTFLCNGLLVHNCVGWDLEDILLSGFKGVRGKIESAPAKHFNVALLQIVNYIYTLQGESAGAQALSNFDTLLAPFIRYDDLSYKEAKQCMQEFLYNMNVPTRVGFQCLSEDTEILTPRGWRKYDEVEKGDTIKTFNVENGIIEHKTVKKIFRREYEGKMFNLKNRIQDQLISPGHRVVRKKFNTKNKFCLQEIEEINENFKTPPIIPIAADNKNKDIDLTDEEIKLIAWIISEGSLEVKGNWRRVCIYQSKHKNYENFEEIISLLEVLGIEYTVQEGSKSLGDRVAQIRFNAKNSKNILKWFDNDKSVKKVPKKMLEMSQNQSRIFIETYIKGDGHENCKITTSNKEILKSLQQIIVNSGYGFTVGKRMATGVGNKLLYILRVIRHKDTYIQEIKEVDYKGVIWSVNTDNETVIAKRKGKVFITGNTPFSNVTMDLKVPSYLKDQSVIIGGEPQDKTYGDFQKEVDMFNRIFAELMLEGDAKDRPFTFPIPTYNITKDFEWDNETLDPLWEMTAKYGTPYFSNFINSDMKPEDARSMCCRLRLSNKELRKRGGGLFGSNPLTGCYDEKTEVLTENGWKLFKNVNKHEKVFTLSNDDEIELHKPTKYFKYDYNGDMYRFKAKSFDLLVTPNHKMVIDYGKNKKRKFVQAQNYSPSNSLIPKGGKWKGKEKSQFVLPPVKIMKGGGPKTKFSSKELALARSMRKKGNTFEKISQKLNCSPASILNICKNKDYGQGGVQIKKITPEVKINMDNWLKFFGIWLAEGCTDNENIALNHGYRVTITQKNKKIKKQIRKLLNKLPFRFYEEKKGECVNFIICSKQLWTYLRQFGNGYEKFIPKEIKNLSKRQLKILFDWMVKGDGYVRKTTGQINYWTASKKLVNDMQEIVLKLGWMATSKKRIRETKIRGKAINSNKTYVLGIQQSNYYRLRKNNISKQKYNGKVYCLEVPNHTLLVRRNGKVTWSGNSIGVVTLNMPRTAYLSDNEDQFFDRVEDLMEKAKESLLIKREFLENLTEKGMYPYSKFYLRKVKESQGEYWKNHFSTIGLIGVNDALMNLKDTNIGTKEGSKFAEKLLVFMRDKLSNFQEETGDIFNLEATPAEGSSYRLARNDKKEFDDIKIYNIDVLGKEEPVYTNSTQLPFGLTEDIFEALDLQDPLQTKYTGGTVFHTWLGEKMPSIEATKNLVKKIANNYSLPYYTLTPTFSICPIHGYINGEEKYCPKCKDEGKTTKCEVYSRVVGYLRPVEQWNEGKQEEFKDRANFSKSAK